MNAELEVLSPVHIGNGHVISPVEYVVHDEFSRIDMNSFFKDSLVDMDEYIKCVEEFQSYNKFRYKFNKKHYLYTLPVGKIVAEELFGREINEYIKTGGKAYVPGSSIKGSIRTAILYNVLKNDKNKFQNALEILDSSIQKRVYKNRVDNDIDRMVFGNTTHDVLKTLQVTDTMSKDPSNVLRVECTDVLSTTHSNKMYTKFSIFSECLKKNSSLPFSLKIDEFYFSKQADELGFSDKKSLLTNLQDICNEFSGDLIDYEYNFFKQYDEYEDILGFYDKLVDLVYDDDFNGFILRLSWGGGWQSMGVGRLFINEHVFNNLRRQYRLGKPGMSIFPKTRRVVVDDNYLPLGWVRVKLKS